MRKIWFSFYQCMFTTSLSPLSALLADSFAFSLLQNSCLAILSSPLLLTSLSCMQQAQFVSLYPVLLIFHSVIIIPFLPLRILVCYHAFPLDPLLFLFPFSPYIRPSFLRVLILLTFLPFLAFSIFSNFWSSKHRIWIRIRIDKKCWSRIRIESIWNWQFISLSASHCWQTVQFSRIF